MNIYPVRYEAEGNTKKLFRQVSSRTEINMSADDVIRLMTRCTTQAASGKAWSLEGRCIMRSAPQLKSRPCARMIVFSKESDIMALFF